MKKMKLESIEIRSFVTVVDQEEKIKGGYSALDCTPDYTRYPNCPMQGIAFNTNTETQNNL